MVIVFLANGFEELEATAPIDIMRRAGIEVVTVGVGGRRIVGSRGTVVEADVSDDELPLAEPPKAVVLPGGGKGTDNLKNSEAVKDAVREVLKNGGTAAAICAAPTLFAQMGILGDKKATCYPTLAEQLDKNYEKKKIIVDPPFITGEAAGSAVDFGIALAAALAGADAAERVRREIYYGE